MSRKTVPWHQSVTIYPSAKHFLWKIRKNGVGAGSIVVVLYTLYLMAYYSKKEIEKKTFLCCGKSFIQFRQYVVFEIQTFLSLRSVEVWLLSRAFHPLSYPLWYSKLHHSVNSATRNVKFQNRFKNAPNMKRIIQIDRVFRELSNDVFDLSLSKANPEVSHQQHCSAIFSPFIFLTEQHRKNGSSPTILNQKFCARSYSKEETKLYNRI